jgi:hypothetical protein
LKKENEVLEFENFINSIKYSLFPIGGSKFFAVLNFKNFVLDKKKSPEALWPGLYKRNRLDDCRGIFFSWGWK